jgi:hypothetical protein
MRARTPQKRAIRICRQTVTLRGSFRERVALPPVRLDRRDGRGRLSQVRGSPLPSPGTDDAPRGRPGSPPATATGGRPHAQLPGRGGPRRRERPTVRSGGRPTAGGNSWCPHGGGGLDRGDRWAVRSHADAGRLGSSHRTDGHRIEVSGRSLRRACLPRERFRAPRRLESSSPITSMLASAGSTCTPTDGCFGLSSARPSPTIHSSSTRPTSVVSRPLASISCTRVPSSRACSSVNASHVRSRCCRLAHGRTPRSGSTCHPVTRCATSN